MNQNDDEIIAQAFIDLREGILSSDWQKVLSAYEAVTGEKLELPEEKPKSRLESIREQIAKKNPKQSKKSKKSETSTVIKDGAEEIETTLTKSKGGKNFAQNGFNVLSTAPNEQEIEYNKKWARTKIKIPRDHQLESDRKRFNPEDPNREIGYSDTPKIRAPWA